MKSAVQDIKPRTPIAFFRRQYAEEELERAFGMDLVAALVGMSPAYINRVLGGKKRKAVKVRDILILLDLDAFGETFVPRSQIVGYLLAMPKQGADAGEPALDLKEEHTLIAGDARELIRRLPDESVRCVVTSSPYWAMRLYDTHYEVTWADGEVCAYGHEQTPEGFIRHTVEILYLLQRVVTADGSIWWNLMDTFNTRTQVRSNAAETLRAMQGDDDRGWSDYDCRRYSAGHSYLEDGESCMIPSRVAERASRIGYLVRSVITWKKTGSMPETVATRVAREGEFILHLTRQRTPYFDKSAFRMLPERLGGRNAAFESDKITDVWCLPTSAGQDGHGAQFPLALPGRCIGLSTEPGDLVLDMFVGSGTTTVAAAKLGRRSIGFDVDEAYLVTAQRRLAAAQNPSEPVSAPDRVDDDPLGLSRLPEGDGQLNDPPSIDSHAELTR